MNRRHILRAVAAAAVLAIGSSGFISWRAYSAPADLMQPGPLGDESLGDTNAPNVIIEYASMTCPHCARFTNEVFPQLKKRDIDTGRVRYIFREFPLDPVAAGAAALARCAGKDKFFPTIELLFRTQDTWAVDHPEGPLLETVKQEGLTEQSFKACLADKKILDALMAERDRAAKDFGVNATPTFFINGEKKVGEQTIEEIEAALKPAAAPSAPAAPSK
ncbi:MAG TPA: DsbA family protein [Xanthobacteraceae bacterium]|nr:DsbA family protein [Xanthobacteraceae bacterium]